MEDQRRRRERRRDRRGRGRRRRGARRLVGVLGLGGLVGCRRGSASAAACSAAGAGLVGARSPAQPRAPRRRGRVASPGHPTRSPAAPRLAPAAPRVGLCRAPRRPEEAAASLGRVAGESGSLRVRSRCLPPSLVHSYAGCDGRAVVPVLFSSGAAPAQRRQSFIHCDRQVAVCRHVSAGSFAARLRMRCILEAFVGVAPGAARTTPSIIACSHRRRRNRHARIRACPTPPAVPGPSRSPSS